MAEVIFKGFSRAKINFITEETFKGFDVLFIEISSTGVVLLHTELNSTKEVLVLYIYIKYIYIYIYICIYMLYIYIIYITLIFTYNYYNLKIQSVTRCYKYLRAPGLN